MLKPGTNRDLVRAELGDPLKSVGRDECDVFVFQEGSSGWKYLRAMGYSILDIGTLGISEVVTSPVAASVGKTRSGWQRALDGLVDQRIETDEEGHLATPRQHIDLMLEFPGFPGSRFAQHHHQLLGQEVGPGVQLDPNYPAFLDVWG